MTQVNAAKNDDRFLHLHDGDEMKPEEEEEEVSEGEGAVPITKPTNLMDLPAEVLALLFDYCTEMRLDVVQQSTVIQRWKHPTAPPPLLSQYRPGVRIRGPLHTISRQDDARREREAELEMLRGLVRMSTLQELHSKLYRGSHLALLSFLAADQLDAKDGSWQTKTLVTTKRTMIAMLGTWRPSCMPVPISEQVLTDVAPGCAQNRKDGVLESIEDEGYHQEEAASTSLMEATGSTEERRFIRIIGVFFLSDRRAMKKKAEALEQAKMQCLQSLKAAGKQKRQIYVDPSFAPSPSSTIDEGSKPIVPLTFGFDLTGLESLRVVGDHFGAGSAIQCIRFPASLTGARLGLLRNTDNLTFADLSSTQLTSLPGYAFSDSAVKALLLPPTLREINDHVLSNTPNLVTLDLSHTSLIRVGSHFLRGSGVHWISFPNWNHDISMAMAEGTNCCSFGEYCFDRCPNLEPESLKQLPFYCFQR
jgi:hypothetical protein